MPVRDGVGEGIGHGFAQPEPLYGGGAVVQDVDVGTVGVEDQGPVQARRGRLRHERYDVVGVRIGYGPQRTESYGLDVLGQARGLHRGHGQVVGAADVYGDRADRDAAVLILDRIVEGFGQGLSLSERLHGGQAVVQRIRVGPGGVEGQGAVQAHRSLRREAQQVADDTVPRVVRVRGRNDPAGQEERVLLHADADGRGHGRVVGAVNGYRITSVQGGAKDIGHLVREYVQQCLARSQALHRAQIVVQGIGVGAVGVQGECAVQAVQSGGAVCQPVEQAAQDAERIGRNGQSARGGELDVFRDVAGAGDHARFLQAVDGHRQGIASGRAVVVRHRVGKGVGERLTRSQRLYDGKVVVQGIEIGAVRIHRQGAVGSGCGRLGNEGDGVMGVRIPGDGEVPTGDDLGVFGNGGCRRRYGGCVVCAVDGHGQGVGAGAAVLILDGIGKDFLKGFPDSQTLHDGKVVVQGVGVMPGGVHDQRAVDAQFGGGHEGEDVADHAVLGVVGIGRRGKRSAGDRCDVFRDLDGGRRGHRRVVCAVDGDGQCAGRGRAVVVRDRIGEGVGQRFTRGQALHRAEAVVEGIEPRAVGVEG